MTALPIQWRNLGMETLVREPRKDALRGVSGGWICLFS